MDSLSPFLAQLLAEATETKFGLEIETPKPLSLRLALIHAIASLPGSGLCAIPARTRPDHAVWLLRTETLTHVPQAR